MSACFTEENKKVVTGGFTIVELLIVVVVIAILAAITIVAYNGIQNQTNDSVIKADLSSATKKLELFKAENGRFPISDLEIPSGFVISKSSYDEKQNNVYYCNDRENNTFSLGFRSKSGRGFIRTPTQLLEGVNVSQVDTCGAIGKTWANNSTTAVLQGYGSGVWSKSWKWIP